MWESMGSLRESLQWLFTAFEYSAAVLPLLPIPLLATYLVGCFRYRRPFLRFYPLTFLLVLGLEVAVLAIAVHNPAFEYVGEGEPPDAAQAVFVLEGALAPHDEKHPARWVVKYLVEEVAPGQREYFAFYYPMGRERITLAE